MIDRYILLAEDNPNDAELTIAALHASNLVSPIHVVADGAEALDFLFCRGAYEGRKGGPPAVILLDLKMPVMSGMEFLEKYHNMPELHGIPVIVLTGTADTEEESKSVYDSLIEEYG